MIAVNPIVLQNIPPLGDDPLSLPFTLTQAAPAFPNETDPSARLDQILMLGVNQNGGGGRTDPSDTALLDSWESHFQETPRQPDDPPLQGAATERHIIYVDKNGNQHRPFSLKIDKESGYTLLLFHVDEMRVMTAAAQGTPDQDWEPLEVQSEGVRIQTLSTYRAGRCFVITSDGEGGTVSMSMAGTRDGRQGAPIPLILRSGWSLVGLPGSNFYEERPAGTNGPDDPGAPAAANFNGDANAPFGTMLAKHFIPAQAHVVTGSWSDGTAQKSLLAQLAAVGLLQDQTTP